MKFKTKTGKSLLALFADPGGGARMALLRHPLRELFRRGEHKIALGVVAKSLTGATHLYEKTGMCPVPKRQETAFEMELRPGVDLSTQNLGS